MGVFQVGDGDGFDEDIGFPHRDRVIDTPTVGGIGVLEEGFQLVRGEVGEEGAEGVVGGLAGFYGHLKKRGLSLIFVLGLTLISPFEIPCHTL